MKLNFFRKINISVFYKLTLSFKVGVVFFIGFVNEPLRAYLGQHSNFPERALLFEKRAPKNLTPNHSIPFLSVLHQNKALHSFCKRGQRSTVNYNIGLEYTLPLRQL